jgi:transposase
MPTYEELLQENAELRRRVAEQERQITSLKRQVEELKNLVEELRRRGKRQAAPFSKGEPSEDPKRPGRKAGDQYGQQATRALPERVDETIEVECPLYCEHCQGKVTVEGEAPQYQTDLPEIRPWTTEFILQYGKCSQCGREVVGRHPRQTSQAFRVGSVQLGPGVLGFATWLNKVGGLSYGKMAALLKELAGLEVSRSALCRALLRMGKKLEPLYEELKAKIRNSPVVYPDETGWREGGHSVWLWVFTNRSETVYSIQPGRGYAEASEILGKGYAGVLVADGWAPYQRFEKATHQTCLAHLLRRCDEMLEQATGGAARFPRAVKEILQSALEVRDQRDAGKISGEALEKAKEELESQMDGRLSGQFTNPSNQRLAQHLIRHQDQLFLFLERKDVEATNWPAEQGIRPAVVNRKTSGGNRTAEGSQAQAVLMSILRTFQQHQLSALEVLPRLLRSPQALQLEALLPSPQPP